MPKLIDHAQRREEIATAAWRVILQKGIGAVSVRTVAAEAGLSVGSVRHVFASQTQLLAFAMELVIDRAADRITALPERDDPIESMEDIAIELLPLDEERRSEMEVYLALFAATGTDPLLIDTRAEAWGRVHAGCRTIVTRLAEDTPVTEEQLEREVIRLHALVDGLAAHLVWQPEEVSEAAARSAIIDHLHELTTRLGGG